MANGVPPSCQYDEQHLIVVAHHNPLLLAFRKRQIVVPIYTRRTYSTHFAFESNRFSHRIGDWIQVRIDDDINVCFVRLFFICG